MHVVVVVVLDCSGGGTYGRGCSVRVVSDDIKCQVTWEGANILLSAFTESG